MLKFSFLMPSRDRHDSAKVACHSVLETCKFPDRVELVVRVDDDDAKSQDFFSKIAEKHNNVKIIVGERGIGYGDLHKYYNDALGASSGDYHHIWGNDNEMKTKHWDVVLESRIVECEKRPMVVWPHKGPKYPHFPCISNEFFSHMGKFPDYPFIDTYILFVTNECVATHKLAWFETTSTLTFSHKEIRDHLWPGHNRKFKHLSAEEIKSLSKEHADIIADKLRKIDR